MSIVFKSEQGKLKKEEITLLVKTYKKTKKLAMLVRFSKIRIGLNLNATQDVPKVNKWVDLYETLDQVRSG